MDTLTFHFEQPKARSISFTQTEGLRVCMRTTLGWEEVYDLGHERATELWTWLGDLLVAPESVVNAELAIGQAQAQSLLPAW